MIGGGMKKPVFSRPEIPWNATPTTRSSWITGPPLLPGLIAASVCTVRNARLPM